MIDSRLARFGVEDGGFDDQAGGRLADKREGILDRFFGVEAGDRPMLFNRFERPRNVHAVRIDCNAVPVCRNAHDRNIQTVLRA